jgi:adenylate cyclase
MRIGVALGEVVIAHNTITGDGVILAQRLEQLAEPGGICVQGAIYDAAPSQMPIEYTSIGRQELKGFSEPVQAFAVSPKQGIELPPISRRPHRRIAWWPVLGTVVLVIVGCGLWYTFSTNSVEPIDNEDNTKLSSVENYAKSIAVLGFENTASDSDQEYFANGIAEDIITELSRISDLKVIARSSSFAYRGQALPAKTVGKELNVAFLLEGSVSRYADRLRLNVQLIDVQSGTEAWSERYDREISDIFVIQQEITELIVDELRVKLNASERAELESSRHTDIDAYNLFLRGLEKHSEFNATSNIVARDYFLKAVGLDQGFARAYASVALTYAIEVNMNWTSDRLTSIETGLEYADRALGINDRSPHAYFAQASLFLAQHRHASAVATARRAIELAPNYADGHAQLAFHLTNSGAHEESLQSLATAKKLNPRYTLVFLMVEAMALFQLRQYEQVIELLEKEIDRNLEYDRTHLLMAVSYAYLGRADDANWSLEEAIAANPDLTLESEKLNSVLKRQQDLDHYLEGLKLAGL